MKKETFKEQVIEKITFPVPETVKTPWFAHRGSIPATLEYDDCTMYEKVEAIARKYPGNIAFDFMGKHTTYKQMLEIGRASCRERVSDMV